MSEVTAAAATAGQELDKEVAVVKARLAVLEAKGKTDWAKVKAFAAANWPHVVTWITSGAVAVKLGLVADVVKFL